MCGIAGYCSFGDTPPDRAILGQMIGAMKHRGPDGTAIHVAGPVGLAHARLSIIDLEGGRQPLFNEDQTVSVVVNGEIYNYRELRSDLIRRGHRFRTGSDCEVIVHLWEERREQLLDELRGMFAFVLYDHARGTLFGARDRFGQKPLYYQVGSEGFAFASEIKGLTAAPEFSRELDHVALDQFLFHQYVPQPRTLFAGVKRLPAGSCFTINNVTAHGANEPVNEPQVLNDSARFCSTDAVTYTRNRHCLSQSGQPAVAHPITIDLAHGHFVRRYWRPEFAPANSMSDADHLDRVEAAIRDAVDSHLVADVPVGLFLSGGIDSSLIAAFASRIAPEPLRTYCVSFPGSRHDEAPYARTVSDAFGTQHREIPFQPDDYSQNLTHAARLFDQPLADAAALPLMALSRAAAEDVKVVLTGDGGDELFAGYRKYRRMVGIPGRLRWLTQWTEQVFPTSVLARCAPDAFGWRKCQTRIVSAVAPATGSFYHRQGWEGWERFALYRPELIDKVGSRFESIVDDFRSETSALDPLNLALEADQGTCLADRLLLKADYSTMAHGLEARAPLLDHLLADVAAQLPLHLKATSKTTKVALREIARRHLPGEVVDRRKKGFSMSTESWFRNELANWTRNCLIDDSVSLPRYFDRKAIEQLLAEHQSGHKNHATRIHTLLTFELWMREYMG